MQIAAILPAELIESVTCHAGAHSDNHLLSELATIPGREADTPSACAHALSCTVGHPMKNLLRLKTAIDTRLSPVLELKKAPDSSGAITGYASAFGGAPDSYGDIIAPGAFRRTLAEHKRNGTLPVMLWSHDMKAPIGRWTVMAEDQYGLHVEGKLNLETTGGRDAYAHVKNGDVGGFSIGFMLAENGWKSGANGTKLLTDIELLEVSVVSIPANSRARVQGIKTLSGKNELIALLRDGGLPKAAAIRVASGGWSALADDETEKAHAVAAEIKALTAQLRNF